MPRTADTSPREPELARRVEEFRAAAARAEALAGGLSADRLTWRPEPGRWSVAECLEHLVRTGEVYLRVLDRVIEEGRDAGALADGPFRHGLVDRWLVRFLEPPPGFGIPAPRIIDPRRKPGSSDAIRAGGAAAIDPAVAGEDGAGTAAGGTDGAGAASTAASAGTDPAPAPAVDASGADASAAASPDASSPLPRFVALQDRLVKRLGAADGLDLSGLRVRSPFVPLLSMDLGTAFAVVAAHQRRHLWQAEQVTGKEGFPA